jgi:O-antigen ligase
VKRAAEIAFLIFIASLATMRPSLNFSGLRIVPADAVFPLLAMIVGLAATRKKIILRFDSLYWPIAAYVFAMAFATLFSGQAAENMPKLAGIIYLAAIAFISINLIDSPEMMQRAAKVWVFASTVAAAIGSISVVNFYLFPENYWSRLFLHHYGSLPPGNYPRIQATFVYPSMLCNYFTISIALLFGLYSVDKIRRSFFILSITLHAIAAFFTLTPGLGGVFILFAFYLGRHFRQNGYQLLSQIAIKGGIGIAALFILIAAFSPWRIETSPFRLNIAGLEIDPTQRLLAWQQAAQTFVENPIIGRGTGRPAAYVIFKAPSGQMQLLTDAHQSWLNIAAQAGIIGLGAFLWLSVALLLRAFNSARREANGSEFQFWLFLGFVSAFLYQGLVGSFEDARHLWAFFGFLVADRSSSIRNKVAT